MSKARLTEDVDVRLGMRGTLPKGRIVTTLVHAPSLEGDSPIPPRPGTMRLGMAGNSANEGYVILTSENCEAVD